MYDTRITSPQAKTFAKKYGDSMEAIEKAYTHGVGHRGHRGTLDDYIIQMEGDIERSLRNMKNPMAIELAEKHADKLPTLFVEYTFDMWTGAIRLSFEDYLPYVARQRALKGLAGIA